MFKKRHLDDIQIKILICADVLEAIFDECDRHNENETGGRLIGSLDYRDYSLTIKVRGVIEAGPNARRSPTSFFQDGEYQENIFRKVEAQYPNIDHLGNWHTHHVNGLNSLSRGDIDTYNKTVNHENHNTDFFYALLIVHKNQSSYRERYSVKHYLFKRGDSLVYEIPGSQVRSISEAAIFLAEGVKGREVMESEDIFSKESKSPLSKSTAGSSIRVRDKEVISEMFPSILPFYSKRADSVYWRGNLDLIDNTPIEIIVLESITGNKISYSIALTGSAANLFSSNRLHHTRSFNSASAAIYSMERDLNREIFRKLKPRPFDHGR